MVRLSRSAVRTLAFVIAGALFVPGSALAIEHQVDILLDLDDDASTGCTVATVDGPFDGVEQILVTTVETTSPPPAGTVTDVAIRDCTNPGTDTFGPPASFDGGWPVGIDNGVGGRDVVETYFPLVSSVVSNPERIRLGVVVTDELGGEQALLTVDDTPDGEPIVLVARVIIDPADIPTLGEWGLILLALALATASFFLLGRRGTVAFGVALLLLATGTAWAAAGGLDGLTGDWAGIDPLASNGIVLFGKTAAGELCFRVDVDLLFNTSPTADPQAVVTDEETPVAIVLTGSDPESDPLTFTIVSGPSHGTLAGAPPNVTYTPDPDYEGPDSFEFEVEDPSASTDTAIVSITVTGVNDAPVVDPAAFSVAEDEAPGSAVGTVTFTDPDAGQSHTFAITAGNTGGAFAIDASTGEITVATALDFETLAAYSLTVEVTDDGAPVLSGSATIDITVTDADDAPVAVDDAATVTEDDPATTIDVLANDTDVDGGPISVQSVTQPANGTVVITNGGADLTYQPDADSCNDGAPTDDFTYTLNGGSTATVSVTVTCVDDDPVAVDDAAVVTEDDPATAIDVLANDTDVDAGSITVGSVTQPGNGTVVITGGGTGLTYQPDADYCNTPPGTTLDTFTYTLAPGGSTATVTVTVTCEDDAPIAVADAATVGEDSGANAIDVLANDTDVDGGPKSVQSVTQPADGVVAITGGGTGLTYTPNANYCNDGTPTDDFTYTLNGGSSTTVAVTVTCADDPPLAVDDTATVGEDSGANPIDVLLNDTDIDAGTKMVTVVQSPSANGGTVTITGGGSGVAYTPAANYCNSPPGTTPDTFTYTLNGGSMATVSVTVTCVDDAPVLDLDADDDKGTGGADFAVAYTEGDGTELLQDPDDPTGATITDIDSTTLVSLTVTLTNLLDAGEEILDADVSAFAPDITKDYDTTTPGVGVLTISSVTPQPIADYVAVLRTVTYEHTGNDPDETARVIQFVANDGTSDSNTATSTVAVTAVDDPPVAVTDSATVAEDSGATTIDVLANDTDTDGGLIEIQSVTQPTNGTVVITNAGADLTYQPDPDYCNDGTPTDDFTYTLNGGSSTTVEVTVTCTDDPPTAVADAATVAEDSGATAIDVLANDTDPDGGLLEVQSVMQPTNGAVAITGGGTGLTYTPNANYCNSPPGTTLDTFTYTLNGGSSTTVTVTVTCVDDDPVAVADAATVAEDSGANAIAVLANDTDVDGGTIEVQSVTQPTNGAVAITGGGTGVSYTPNANYCNSPPGTTLDTFTYTLNGGSSTSVTVTVTCVDDPPVAVADAATVNEDSGANAIAVLANDTDIDGGLIEVQSVTQPAGGAVAITGGGTGLTYTPNLNYCNDGSPLDTFTYTLNGGSSTTVSMTVVCINDPPVAGNDAFDFIGNTELRVDVDPEPMPPPHAMETTTGGTGLLENDSDPVEGDPISIVGLTVGACVDNSAPFDCTDAAVGRVQLDADGSFSFQPAPGDAGATESFQYTLSDGTDTAVGTVTLTRFERVWYVDNSASPGGDGTSDQPFHAITAANLNDNDSDGDLVDDVDSAGDYIFVHFGLGTDVNLSGGLFLEGGQHLIGEHAGLSLPVDLNGNGAPTVLVAAEPGSRPMLDDNVADGFDGVVARNVVPAEIVGMNLAGDVNAIDWTTTAAFAGTGTFTIRDNVIRGAGGEGVDVNLAGTGATRLAFHDNTLTATGTALDLQETGTGTVTITAFDDNVVSGNTGGSGMVLSNAIFDATPGGAFDLVSGGTTAIGAPGNGVGGAALTMSGVSGDLLFTDLDVFADGGAGLSIGGTGAANLAGGTGLRFRIGAGVGMAVANGGPAVALSNLTGDVQLTTVTSTGSTTTGVSLDGVTDGGGTNAVFTAGGGSAITLPGGASGPAFRVDGGNARVAYGGTITNNATAARAVSITSWAGDDATDDLVLAGAIDENGAGILLNGNSGARAITFSGGLDVDTTTGEGFAATSNTNALGVNVTGSANDIDTVSATALRVTSTPIGSGNLNFRRVSSGNNTAAADPVNGIVLSNTGSAGRLVVTGTGGAGTGGTIQRTTGDGISLTNTTNPSFSFVNVTETGRHGIFGTQVAGLTLVSANIQGAGDANDEDGMNFATPGANNLSGTVLIQNSVINGPQENGLYVQNHSGTLNLTVDNTDFTNSVIENGILFVADGSATLTARVHNGCLFSGHESDGLAGLSQNNLGARLNLTVQGNTFTGDGTSDNAMSIRSAQTAALRFNVDGNTVTGHPNTAILLTSEDSSNNQGTLNANVIGVNAPGSGTGSAIGNGISWFGDDDSRGVVAITNNQIFHTDLEGIIALTNDATAQAANLDITVTGNTVGTPDDDNFPTGFNGIFVRALNQSNVCADIQSNTAPAGSGDPFTPPPDVFDAGLQVQQRNTATFRLERLNGGSGSVASAATVATHLASENPASTTSAQVATSFTGVPNGTCAAPEATPLP